MLDHVEGEDEVEFGVSEGQGADRRVDHIAGAAPGGLAAAELARLDADDVLADAAERGEHRSPATACVEDPLRSVAPAGSPGRVEDDRPAAPVPPMPVLGGKGS